MHIWLPLYALTPPSLACRLPSVLWLYIVCVCVWWQVHWATPDSRLWRQRCHTEILRPWWRIKFYNLSKSPHPQGREHSGLWEGRVPSRKSFKCWLTVNWLWAACARRVNWISRQTKDSAAEVRLVTRAKLPGTSRQTHRQTAPGRG